MGDLAVTSDRHLRIINAVDRHPRSDFTINCAWEPYPYTGRGWKVPDAEINYVWILLFFPFVPGYLAVLASRRRNFCALWLFWHLPHSTMLFGKVLSQASTRISAALAKATVMRLTGALSRPTTFYLPHRNFASNYPGPADLLSRRRQLPSSSSFSPPSYASPLSSLPWTPCALG